MTEHKTNVLAMADQLRQYAEHFVQRDWNYTRNLGGIKHIRYADDYRGYEHPWRRLKRVLRQFVPPRDNLSKTLEIYPWQNPLVTIKVGMRTDDHLPDGVLDGGCIITQWEETGEYLQYVQPSVGSLIADWMEAEPESPHAAKVAAEMKRINDAYGARIDAERG